MEAEKRRVDLILQPMTTTTQIEAQPQQQSKIPQIPTFQQPTDTSKQYDKIRVLGKGSYGVASVHRRRADCSLVVLKEIDLQKFKGEREKQTAINEARIMSTLDHVNIIKYYNSYTTDTKLVIEMEYASIGTLAGYMSLQLQPLEEQEVLVVFRQIASGLNYLHSKSIVHLDLKMANIFVTIEGLVKIGDFSISQYMSNNSLQQHQQQSSSSRHQSRRQKDHYRVHEEINFNLSLERENDRDHFVRSQSYLNIEKKFTSSHLGTLAYSSPERCLGESTDFKSDIWSLGCILYELITSKTLFNGDCLPELILNITRIQYQPIKRKITPALMEIFEQMIAREPDQRPNAQDLLCITGQLLSRIQLTRQSKMNKCQNNRIDLSTEVALSAAHNQDDMSQINYPHSLVYQVGLDSRNIHLNRVNLPQTKRIKEMSKGKSHYLVLTYDNIVYGWGSKAYGQLGACGLTSSSNKEGYAAGIKFRNYRNSADSKELYLYQQLNSSASSLASSTQTIATASPSTSTTINRSTTSINQQHHYQSSKEFIMEMLNNLPPTTRPFVINELNHRKIVQIAAGNNFSVFLSKTGIVMTCGDGSSGCLGRGDLKSCFTPCMVESLLNNDVVSVACGPKHVVAVCGNGRAFAWGEIRHGGLGLGFFSSQDRRDSSLKSVLDSSGRYVLIPQQIQLFTNNLQQSESNVGHRDVIIKSVHCGDKCTIFIDSENHCWACGENRFNKLGLDIKRRFRKTLIVEKSWTPTAITALKKYKIISCNIGKNHSSFITSEGKLIVLGQDLDHTYRLKSNIVCARDSHRRISFELQTARRRGGAHSTNRLAGTRHESMNNNALVANNYTRSSLRPYRQLVNFSYKQLTRESILNNQLKNFKSYSRELRGSASRKNNNNKSDLNHKLSKPERVQLDTYMKKSRCIKKMPFECVISVSCTPKFTLALTNDNHVYFWGTRSYKKDANEFCSLQPHKCRICTKKRQSIEPQLVASCSDECFIKIGATNSSLMSSIQVLGSDQPIIHAQDPRLKADSLADLWILDYKPSSSSSSSSSCSSSSSSIVSSTRTLENSVYSSCSSFDSTCSLCCAFHLEESPDRMLELEGEELIEEEDCMKHAAILEPQPIVSLYIPSMFNHHNGCSLNLVDLFCFDDDRFYLVLDTTIKFQPNSSYRYQNRAATGASQSIKSINSQATAATRATCALKVMKTLAETIPDNQELVTPKDDQKEKDLKLGKSGNSSPRILSKFNYSTEQNRVNLENPAELEDKDGQVLATTTSEKFQIPEENRILVDDRLVEQETLQNSEIDGKNPTIVSCDVNNNNLDIYHHHINDNNEINLASSSQGGEVSLEEPRSLSTFANSMGNHITVAPSMRILEMLDPSQQLKPLDFNINQQNTSADESTSNSALSGSSDNESIISATDKRIISGVRRTKRILVNGSESTTACNDDTSSMPDWVRNEYIQYQQNQDRNVRSDNETDGIFQAESSSTECTKLYSQLFNGSQHYSRT